MIKLFLLLPLLFHEILLPKSTTSVDSPYSVFYEGVSGEPSTWPSQPDPNHPGEIYYPICVCAVDSASLRVIDKVEAALEDSWERYSRIDFQCFQLCSSLPLDSQANAIGWQLVNPGKNVSNVGYSQSRGKVLPDSASTYSGIPANKDGKPRGKCAIDGNFDECIKQFTIHEFGHAIGFMHEMVRIDRPCGCESNVNLADGSTVTYIPEVGDYGHYDDKSIMAYNANCIDPESTSVRFGSSELSIGDILGVQRVYGVPSSISAQQVASYQKQYEADIQSKLKQPSNDNKPAEKYTPKLNGKQYCFGANDCIPDSDDPHHPKYFLNYPVEPEVPKNDLLGGAEFYGLFNEKTESQKYSISPDGSIIVTLECQAVNTTLSVSNWYRSSKIETCWVEWSTSTSTRYRCQNWNTIWGDTHEVWFDVLCTACETPGDSGGDDGEIE